MTTTEPETAASPTSVNIRRDVAVMCRETGSVVMVSTDERPHPDWARAVFFMASGDTFWFEAPVAAERWNRSFHFTRVDVDGRQRIRLATNAAVAPEPTEVLDTGIAAALRRVPLTLDIVLEPLSMPSVIDDPTAPAEPSATAQGFRVTGSLAIGSMIHWLDGQAWSSTSGFSATTNESGTRAQAAFQDASGLYAHTGAVPRGKDGRTAARVVHTKTSASPIERLEVSGPDRGPLTTMICDLGGRSPARVTGAIRHADAKQHVAFVRRSHEGRGWVRIGYTPFDFVRSGVTGFGLLETVTSVDTAEAPVIESDGPPDPF